MFRILFLFLLFVLPASLHASESNGTILPGFGMTRICQNDTCSTFGRVNWRPTINANTNGLITVSIQDTGLAGHIWGEEIGWVNLDPSGAGVTINPNTGDLSGNAFANTGSWMNFRPTTVGGNPNVGVSINSTGQFTGWAYVSGFEGGWVEFNCVASSTCIETDWRPIPVRTGTTTPTSTPPSEGGGSGGAGTSTQPQPTTTPPVIIPPTLPPTVTPAAVNPSKSPQSSAPTTPSSDIGKVITSELQDEISLVTPPLVPTPPPKTPSGVVKEEIKREAPFKMSTGKYLLTTIIETIREVFNSVSEKKWAWGWIITALGLVSLIARPLLTSLRIQSLGDAALAIRRLFSMLLPRRRKIVEPWGTVYDVVTKRPLDPAYVALLRVDTGEEVVGAVTDIEGRYGFLTTPGRYRIVPKKTHYTFPSNVHSRAKEDLVYDNLYYGEPFDIAEANAVVRRNIPMDAQGRDWNEEEKVRMGFTNTRKRRQIMILLLNTLFIAGFLYTMYAVAVDPNLWNTLTLLSYGIVWVVEALWKRHFHLTTVVRNIHGQPIPFALIKVLYENQDIVVKQVVADQQGKFYLLVAPGRYRIVVETKDVEGAYHPVLTLRNQNLKRGILLKDIVLGLQ